MEQLVVAEEYIIENVDDEVHVERSAVTIESRDDTFKEAAYDQPMKNEIVNKNSPASKTAPIRNNIAEHSYSFNTEKSSNDILDGDDDENYESEPDEPTIPIPKVKSNQKPNFSNMALVAMALKNLPEQRGTGKKRALKI